LFDDTEMFYFQYRQWEGKSNRIGTYFTLICEIKEKEGNGVNERKKIRGKKGDRRLH